LGNLKETRPKRAAWGWRGKDQFFLTFQRGPLSWTNKYFKNLNRGVLFKLQKGGNGMQKPRRKKRGRKDIGPLRPR